MAEKFAHEGRTSCCSSTHLPLHAGRYRSVRLLGACLRLGYQPTLRTKWAVCRSASLDQVVRSPPSGRVCAWDDLPPVPATTFLHSSHRLRATSLAGIYPAVDPLDSTSRQLDRWSSRKHYSVARRVQSNLQALQGTARHHRDSGHGRTGAGRQAGPWTRAAQRFSASCRSRSTLPSVTGSRGKIVPLADTSRFQDDVDGEARTFPRGLHMVGAIEEVFEKAKTLQ